MVSIPAGSFMMGSPASEARRGDDEGPQRRVTVPAFAAGKFEVTWTEYNACVSAGGCASRTADGFGGGARPVTMVSWDEAVAYTKWLSSKTGQTYRLLSEAEWEYAARAGTTTPFSFGPTISTSQANYDGNYAYGAGSKGEYRHKTTPVGTFSANAFGLHDLHGNVWEWVQDCYAANYSAGQPSNSAAHAPTTCSSRVSRGGSWWVGPQQLRSAQRFWSTPASRDFNRGFRVARTL
jgi:formylglycine-generating enzyme required for sulfatase activity